jgi:PAS domain S-box-containing protein
MGAYSNPKRHRDDSELLARSPAVMPHQVRPAAGDVLHGKASEQLPSLVRARVQDAAAEKEGVLCAIFQAVTEPLFLLDRERRIVACNEAAAKQVGRVAQELVGVAISECWAVVVPAEVCELRMAQIAKAFCRAAPVRFTDQSASLTYENAICPVLDGNGKVAGVIVTIRDVSECGAARREFPGYDGNTPRAERLAALGMVGATLAHEMTQPLSVAQLATQNALAELERLTCPGAIRRDLQAALAACERIGEITGHFRDLARPPGKAKETEVYLSHVAERTFQLLEETARQARVRFGTENLDPLPAVWMRGNDLNDLFFALVQNAVQAADGAKERCLLVAGSVQGDAVVLRFQDDCGGIEPAHLPKIFEPFFTTKPPDEGTGLGLCIARRIVCQRGGQISVESCYGEGTTFTVTLPREASPEAGGRYVP